MTKSPYDILKRPLITEQAMKGQLVGKYTFAVAIDANKKEIKQAVEKAFGVKVVSVNTVTTKGKVRRVRFKSGRKPTTKKAIITLAEGQALEIA